MIKAVSFDLDGVLVQTERLKAISYARAATELCPRCADEETIVEAFKEVVGRSREEVAQALVGRFGLEESARAHMADFGVDAPWKAYVQVRLRIYKQMLADLAVLRDSQWPQVIALVQRLRRSGYRVALSTMSSCEVTFRILEALDLRREFEFVASGDDVERGKPDPEIYQVLVKQLTLAPRECLAIEDSTAGIQSALAAGLWCIAPTSEFTRDAVHAARLLEDRWVVDDPGLLEGTVQKMLAEREGD